MSYDRLAHQTSAYYGIGNALWSTNNGVGTAYWTTPLNQYTNVSVASAPPCEIFPAYSWDGENRLVLGCPVTA